MSKFKIVKRGRQFFLLRDYLSYLTYVPSITNAVFRAVKNKNAVMSSTRIRSIKALEYIKEKLNA
jgi:hypothetical protein